MPAGLHASWRIRAALEKHFREMQDFEFTVENGKLFMLQTRNGKRTGVAAVRIAVEMVKEKLITWQKAVARVPADQLSQLLTPIFDREAIKHAEKIATGLPAGPGAATGRIYFNADRAAEAEQRKGKVLLVREETSPEDIRGMLAAEGILTARGGVSSHAALVARQMGKVCVCGASALHIDYHAAHPDGRRPDLQERRLPLHRRHQRQVYAGEVKTAPSEIVQVLIETTLDAKESATYGIFAQLMSWARQAPPACRSAPTPTSPTRSPTRSLSARRASASAAPSTCSSRATASTRCAR